MSAPWAAAVTQGLTPLPDADFAAYLDDVRAEVLGEIDRIIPRGGPVDAILYERMRDYPLRPAKGLRPALCLAVCRTLGAPLAAVLRTAAVIEMYHNAFLIHDDVEDQSWSRRSQPTLHAAYGEAIAVNVGDGMLLLCQEALDANLKLLGLGPALRIRRVVLRMAREAVEGQAMELEWIRANRWDLTDADYLRMVHKKTTWYSFTAPLVLGAQIASLAEERHVGLRCLAALLGGAFQIQDDVLNLVGDPARTGKERCGDLWEGKHTLVLAHMMRSVSDDDRRRLTAVLAKARPPGPDVGQGLDDTHRTADDVSRLLHAIERCGSVDYARRVAARRIARAERLMRSMHAWLPACSHRDFLDAVIAYVLRRST